jgi:hypothetical protein
MPRENVPSSSGSFAVHPAGTDRGMRACGCVLCLGGGEQVKETRMYSRFLPPGSVLLLHDWKLLDLPKPHWEVGVFAPPHPPPLTPPLPAGAAAPSHDGRLLCMLCGRVEA